MLEKQNFIPEPEAFIAENPLTPALQKRKRERDEEIKKVYYTVLEAQTKALEAASRGERGCFRLDQIARDVINGAGYEGRFGHSLGHGVGMFIHESPRLAPGMDTGAKLVTGNVVTFEPGIYIP